MPQQHPQPVNMSLTPHRCSIDGISLAWQECGDGPPLLLIHGLSGSARWWSQNIPALAQHFHIYAVDLVGFGESRGHPRQRFDLQQAAGLIAHWMREHRLNHADVIGHSMGGYVALDLAAEYPEAVEHLVLVDAAILPAGTPLWRSAAGLGRSFRNMPLGFLPTLATDALRAGPLTILHATRQIHLSDLRPKLSRVTAPVLVVWGEHDTVVPPEVGVDISRMLPHAHLEIIPAAGHVAMWDRPETFNRIVTGFLTDRDTSGCPVEQGRNRP